MNLNDADENDSGDDVGANTRSVDVAWGNYVRFLFAPHSVYCFTSVPTPRFFYVAENKSVAYRDAPKQGEAIGRPISVIWLERSPDGDGQDGDDTFIPVAGSSGDLHVVDLNLAEISLASGYYLPDVQPHHSDRDVELLHEERCLQHDVERFESKRVSAADCGGWSFVIDRESGVDIEY